MRSFNCAYEKLAEYGGTLYVVGESKCDGKIKDKGYERAVVIEGYSDRSSIVMTDGYTLDLYTDTTIRSVGFETSGNAVISCRSAVLSLEDGIVCSSGISVEMCGDTDLLLTVRSGSYASVVGAAAESAKNVKVNIIGARVDSVLGARYNAQSVRVEVVGSGVGTLRAADGEVLDSYVVKLAESDVSEYTASLCSGKSIFSVADAAVDALDLSALSGSGESTLVLGRGTDEDELSEYHKYFDLVKRENAVFIADGGTGKGLSALSPMGDIKSAVKALGASGSVVVCGDVTVESSYHQVAAHSYPVTITSVCEDADYRDRAYLVLNDDLIFGGETCIENIQLACSASSVFIYAYEHKLTIGYGVDTTLTNANTSYINITGGRSLSSGNGDADITINSGNWGKVRCGSVKTGTVSKSRSKIDITVNGGIFHGYFVCGSRGNVYGDIDLVVNDGVFYQGIYAVFEEDTVKYDKYFNYDVVFDIRGGEFYSYIAPACSKTTELHGSYTVYARGGNFDHLTDMCGAQEYAGDMTSALFRDPSVDTEALPEGSSSFTNYLRHNNADPWLFYHDGYYYYTRTGGTTISLIKTANIGDIKGAYSKVILRPTEGKNLWSPEIHYFSDEEAGEGQGGWYMFVGYDDGTTSNQRQYVLKCLDG
ncbi:MAG: hypothetical protein IJE84_05880, partial [Clostridia bacterium]|nr:hypothetical protein [Clostridia bacterium]